MGQKEEGSGRMFFGLHKHVVSTAELSSGGESSPGYPPVKPMSPVHLLCWRHLSKGVRLQVTSATT